MKAKAGENREFTNWFSSRKTILLITVSMQMWMISGGWKAQETCWSAWSSSWRLPARRWCSATYSRCHFSTSYEKLSSTRIRGWPRGGSQLWPPRTSLMLSRWRSKAEQHWQILKMFQAVWVTMNRDLEEAKSSIEVAVIMILIFRFWIFIGRSFSIFCPWSRSPRGELCLVWSLSLPFSTID